MEVRLEKEDTGSQRIYALMAGSITKEVATCENNFFVEPNSGPNKVPNCEE